jgi:hypothetical protein
MRDDYQHKMKKIFIACEASHSYSNIRHFGSHTPTQVRRFENCALCTGYLYGQTKCSTFQRKVHRDVTVVQLLTRIADSSMCIKQIINPVWHQVKLIIRLKIEGYVKLVSGTQCMKSGFNRGVRSVSADEPVA